MTSPNTAATSTADDRYSEVYDAAQFVTGLILYPVFCFFGLAGNCLTVVVLRSRKLGGVMSAFLAALAVSDSVKLINDLFYFLVILFKHVRPTYGDLAFNVIYPYAHLVAVVTRHTWLPWQSNTDGHVAVCPCVASYLFVRGRTGLALYLLIMRLHT